MTLIKKRKLIAIVDYLNLGYSIQEGTSIRIIKQVASAGVPAASQETLLTSTSVNPIVAVEDIPIINITSTGTSTEEHRDQNKEPANKNSMKETLLTNHIPSTFLGDDTQQNTSYQIEPHSVQDIATIPQQLNRISTPPTEDSDPTMLITLNTTTASSTCQLTSLLPNNGTNNERNDGNESEQHTMKEGYDAILERVRSEQLAWGGKHQHGDIQNEEDHACDICHDGGESVPDNRIIVCEACHVRVHQRCYGVPVENVPTEADKAWYCHACLYYKRDSVEARSERKRCLTSKSSSKLSTPLPIDCELCPRKQGAFKQTGLQKNHKRDKSKNGVKWAHVLCAKWQGFTYIEGTNNAIIEDVSASKVAFRHYQIKCCLCEGMRGTYNKCRVEGCDNWMHITCARSSGLCNIKHGEDHSGLLLGKDAWSLACPEHSLTIASVYNMPNGHKTIDQLKEMSTALPDEPMPEPIPRPFHKMSSRERTEYFDDPEQEATFCQKILKTMKGRCEICDKPDGPNAPLSKCDSCGCVAHRQCYLYIDDWKSVKRDGKMINTCGHCLYKESEASSPDSKSFACHMCNQKSGTLIKAKASHLNKKWATKKYQSRFRKSLFGHQIWVHPSCGL
jgi:hypothetical protein